MATTQQQSMAWRLCQTGELEEPGISGVHMHSEGSAGILLKGFWKRIVSGFHKFKNNPLMMSCLVVFLCRISTWPGGLKKRERAKE